MSRVELNARLALRALPRMQDEERLALLRTHGTARAALDQVMAAPWHRAALASPELKRRVAAAARVVDRLGVVVLTPGDDAFPALAAPLLPPPVLFARGDPALLGRPCVAVVGTRRCTEYGEDVAHELGSTLAKAGVVVVSGMARGIDAVAHRAALAANGGTVAVLGCGIDVVYPREHGGLHEEIAGSGLLLSEFLPGEPPRPQHFLQRNRLIAGLTRATVVVEGGARSGAINTAQHALMADLPVFGVPGPLGRGTSDGPNDLLRDGALFYSAPSDVLLAIGVVPRAPAGVPDEGSGSREAQRDEEAGGQRRLPFLPPGLSGQAGRIALSALGRDARHVDAIAAKTAAPAADTLAALLELEFAGVAEQLPGMRFRLARRR